jgi:protein required for attachment to host cells
VSSLIVPDWKIMKKLKRTWIIVADGGEARILLSETGAEGLRQLPNGKFSDPQLPTHELVTDRQPRVRESKSNASHAIEPKIDAHKQRKMKFVKNLLGHIERAAENLEFEHLIIVAPPFILGEIRKDLSPRLQKLVQSEVSHDYVHQTNDYICDQLKDFLTHG